MQRHLIPEIMDDPGLGGPEHILALRGLGRINRWSRSAEALWMPIRALAQDLRRGSLRALDLATGGGDVPLRLWWMARRHGLHLRIDGCDRSDRAVWYARERARETGADLSFYQLDALADPIPSGYDILLSSLFLHHLDWEQTVGLLRRMARAARCAVVVNDLARSRRGLMLAQVGTHLLSGSHVVHADGPQSVRAAYTVQEARELARQAGMDRATVIAIWPCRFLLTCRPV